MGYQTNFRLKGELDSQFKSSYYKDISKKEVQRYKSVLVAICMSELPEDKRTNFFELSAYFDKLYTAVQACVNIYIETWKQNLKDRFEGNEVYFCGWEYSDGRDVSIWDNEEDLICFYANDLFEILTSPAKSRFDEENDTYCKKLQQISDQVDSLEESVWSLMNQKFINFYRDSDKADESDGYNRKYPEEIEEISCSENKKPSKEEDSGARIGSSVPSE